MTKAEATNKVHLSQIRKNSQSTTTNESSAEDQWTSDTVQEPENDKTHLVMATVNETQKIYTDQYNSQSRPVREKLYNDNVCL